MSVSRATIPAEFFDIVSAMLLTQPEPQYFYYQLLAAAMNLQLNPNESLGLPIPGRTFGDQGAEYADVMSGRLEVSDPILGTAIKVVAEFDRPGVGHTIRINRPKFVDSTYTQAARRVPVGTTISVVPVDIQSEQTALTIDRFAGPYDNTNSRVAPYAFERFDANRMLHSMASLKEFHLVRDFHKTMDAFMVSLFNAADATIYPTGMTADNDSNAANDFPFSFSQLIDTQTSLEEAGIPKFDNGRYKAVLTPKQEAQLIKDDDYQREAQYFKEFNPLFRQAYIKSCGAFDLFRSVTLTRSTNSNSVPIQYGHAFGPGAIGVGISEMPRISYNTQDNYGESALLIWILYGAFGMLDSRFVRLMKSS